MEPTTATTIHLPIEVWENIFQHSMAEDAWNFRLVCKSWRKELDDHFNKWAVRLDQDSQYFQHVLQLKVKEAKILDLSTPVDMSQDGTPRLFKHPEFLEKVSIPDDCYISPENLLLLLSSCGKTIKHLDIEVDDVEDMLADPSYDRYPNGFEFANLESLKLNFCNPDRPLHTLTLFELLVGLSTMRKIKSLRLDILGHACINALSSKILAFIGKNGTNVEVIDCSLYPGPEDEEAAQPAANSIDLALLRQVTRLKEIKIEYDFDEPYQVPWVFVEAWSTLLEVQKNLTQINLIELPISLRVLTLVCHNNTNSLTKIALWGLNFEIDLGILTGCVDLKELRFSCGWQDEQDRPVLRNARSLPVGIQKFDSNNYLMESEDILDFFVGHGELVEIELSRSGCVGLYGLTAAVFDHFVANRNLSDKLEKIHIRGFNCSTAEDLTALNEIVRGLEHQSWVDKEDFREVAIRLDRTRGEGGDWSALRITIYEL